jgi:Tol biopolymer transport system component
MKDIAIFILSKIKKILLLLFLLFIFIVNLKGQFYNGSQISFGKNRVQYQKFNWTYYRTEQFDVYFYPTGKDLADYTLHKVPGFISEIEKFLNFSSYKKLQFIVYNTQSDFRESNFAFDNEDFYNQGGVTNIYGTKIYLYFDGNHAHFDKMIRSGIMNIYAHLLVEGQSVASNISSESLLNVPIWYYSGLASYYAESWNSELDAFVKDGILTQRFANFDQLSLVEAAYAGHSFWKFIVDKYGPNAIANILYSTRSSKNFERGFYYVTGVEYKKLLVDWYRYYYVIYKKDTKRNLPENNGIVKNPKKKDYSQITLSPDGKSFAFVSNDAGQVKIWLKTTSMNRPKMIFKHFQKIEDNPDLSFPLLAWHPDGHILGFTFEEKGRCYYYPFLIETGKLGKKLLVDVEKITDWSYSNDAQLLLFSGFKNGQSDIFIYSFLSRSILNITNDFFDDFQPKFLHDQKKIIFSSNRNKDTIALKDNFYNIVPGSSYDLFIYNYIDKDPVLFRVTNTPSANENAVCEVSDKEIIFLSDESGITNRYLASFDSTISKIDTVIHFVYWAKSSPLTDNAYSFFEQDYMKNSDSVASIILYKGSKRIYKSPLSLFPVKNILVASAFKEQLNYNKHINDSLNAIFIANGKDAYSKHGFYQLHLSDIAGSNNPDSTRNFNAIQMKGIFDEGDLSNTTLTRNYYVQYSLNKLITQADFSFLNTSYQQYTGTDDPIYLNTGFNALLMVGIQDLFENYRITGGFRLSFDLSGNEFMLSYEDLSRRFDHQIVIYRQSIKSNYNDYVYKQRSNSLFYIIKYPFNKTNSVRLTFTGRYERYIMGALSDVSLKAKDENHLWTGLNLNMFLIQPRNYPRIYGRVLSLKFLQN